MKSIVIRDTNAAEETRKQICLEQLAQDRQKLLLRWPFVGGVVMRMELVPVRDDRLDTACTDGDNIFVDIDFFSKLTGDERLFVLAHEVWHSVLLHFVRRQKRDRDLFNIAADLEIHFTLACEKIREPFVLPHDPNWRGLSAEEIYERLPGFLKNLKQSGKPMGGGMSPSKGDGEDSSAFGNDQGGFDKHIYQDDILPDPNACGNGNGGRGDDRPHEINAQGGGNGEQGGVGTSQKSDDGKGTESNPFVMDKDYNPHVSSETVERSRSRTIASAQQMERTQGKLPAGIQALLDKLQKPSLPWQEMLKQFVTTCYGGKRRWLPPARRHVWQDLYLPSMRDEALRAFVAIDTSGSTRGDLPVFFGELVSLMKSFGKFDLDVIQCDAKVQDVSHYSEANLPPPDRKWEVKGLGGTDFRPVFEYIQKKKLEQPDLLLFFTDGCGTAPKQRPAYPVMWVLTSDGSQPADWGRVMRFKNQ